MLTTVKETEHFWIPMTDGTRLSARLWLPQSQSDDPTPAIFEYIPYRKRDMVRLRDERNHPVFARRGFARPVSVERVSFSSAVGHSQSPSCRRVSDRTRPACVPEMLVFESTPACSNTPAIHRGEWHLPSGRSEACGTSP